MRFVGTCYRAHDPKWSFKPLSGEGGAQRGGRFNPRGTPALYLSLSIMTAVKEANQGFAFKIQPCVLCCYEVDCEDVADLRTDAGRIEHGVSWEDMACAWFSFLADGREPPSWHMVRG
ncbi:MAG: RES domain-containing protein, partial [Acetobacteraceae bacterium]|nr:RES domain-containing protein [Acetobacteraceae bacterium]